MRLSSIEASVLAGEVRDSAVALGESTASDNGEVPGLCLTFLEGEGESVGPGVSEVRLSFDRESSVERVRGRQTNVYEC